MHIFSHPIPLVTLLLAPLVAAGGCGPSGSGSPPGGAPTTAESPPAVEQSSTEETAQIRRPAAGSAWVIFGTDTVAAQVARTADQRSQGLMDREELAEDAGMLFVFESAEERSFWMSNTAIALDIAYMDPQFRIFTIKPMEPMSEDLVDSDGPAQYALEVNQGWFEEHGVRVGAQPEIVFGR